MNNGYFPWGWQQHPNRAASEPIKQGFLGNQPYPPMQPFNTQYGPHNGVSISNKVSHLVQSQMEVLSSMTFQDFTSYRLLLVEQYEKLHYGQFKQIQAPNPFQMPLAQPIPYGYPLPSTASTMQQNFGAPMRVDLAQRVQTFQPIPLPQYQKQSNHLPNSSKILRQNHQPQLSRPKHLLEEPQALHQIPQQQQNIQRLNFQEPHLSQLVKEPQFLQKPQIKPQYKPPITNPKPYFKATLTKPQKRRLKEKLRKQRKRERIRAETEAREISESNHKGLKKTGSNKIPLGERSSNLPAVSFSKVSSEEFYSSEWPLKGSPERHISAGSVVHEDQTTSYNDGQAGGPLPRREIQGNICKTDPELTSIKVEEEYLKGTSNRLAEFTDWLDGTIPDRLETQAEPADVVDEGQKVVHEAQSDMHETPSQVSMKRKRNGNFVHNDRLHQLGLGLYESSSEEDHHSIEEPPRKQLKQDEDAAWDEPLTSRQEFRSRLVEQLAVKMAEEQSAASIAVIGRV